ncbi:PilZ domain-containing protein [Bdellovibrio reynosensis]|uniref:PilZ domain-containing protein n=1 Tax=Bdellovibrio reynosensis TaxID=2835041 RepID=A0ABY4CF70_9BACT|nr:PilZ domain-containing protein [Bdellovibrio reynosensis]UOF02311.1 PilZ domain-containing protein [Bdellovibrio reynosensis]
MPSYLQALEGVRWSYTTSAEQLKYFINSHHGELTVIIRADFLSLRAVKAFATWAHQSARLSFIFIAQTIENAAFQLGDGTSKMVFLLENEGSRITLLINRFFSGQVVKCRRQERQAVQSQVMLKKSVYANHSPTGAGVQFLREGQMNDFSQGGAQISVEEGGVREKDFISLMYQNRFGQWVSVESQVRWVVSTSAGEQIIGVQFLAVNA